MEIDQAPVRADKVKSYLLVGIQFGVLILIALTGPWLASNPLLLVLEVAAVALGVWAILAVRIDNVNITPGPRPDAELVQSGPYRWIRHPMYAALLLGALVLVINAPSLLRWGLWLVLAVDLLIKLHYEERLLSAHFPGYAAYQQTSKRLIPFIY